MGFIGLTVFSAGVLADLFAHRLGVTGEVKRRMRFVVDDPEKSFRAPRIPARLEREMRRLGFDPLQIASPQDFVRWKETAVTKARDLLQMTWIPRRKGSKVTTLVKNDGSYTVEKVVLELEDDEDSIILYRLTAFPKTGEGRGGRPGVLCIPGSGIGARRYLVGAGRNGPHDLVETLVSSGYVVYVVENLGWGERRSDPGSEGGADSASVLGVNSILIGNPLGTRYVLEARLAFEYLLGDEDVDAGRAAVVGSSLGGNIAVYLSAIEGPRVAATVVASGVAPSPHAIGANQLVIPGMWRYFDVVDLAAAIAPQALLLTYGRYDQDSYRYQYFTHGVESVLRRAWAIQGKEGAFDVKYVNGGHEIPTREVAVFLDKHLAWKRRIAHGN